MIILNLLMKDSWFQTFHNNITIKLNQFSIYATTSALQINLLLIFFSGMQPTFLFCFFFSKGELIQKQCYKLKSLIASLTNLPELNAKD